MPPELSLDPSQLQTLVHSSDLELGETVNAALAEIERIKPDRVVFDSLSEIRLLSQGSLRYRRQVLALKSFFLLNHATVLLLDDLTAEHDDVNLHSISHGVIRMEQLTPIYGGERRRLRVIKMRGGKSAAVIMTSSSGLAASQCFHAWSPPTTRRRGMARPPSAGIPLTPCWAEGWIGERAPC